MNGQSKSTGTPGGHSQRARELASLTPELIEGWIRAAQPNARLIYFHGWHASKGVPAVNEKLHDAQARGLINLVQDPRSVDGEGRDYLAIRTSRPWGAKAPARVSTLADQAIGEAAHLGRGGRR